MCKHHDGFCLWPSRYTDYSVKSSPWRNGHGDLVLEISEACHEQGLAFGVYLSPWDRHHKGYGRPEYLTYYRNQLSELLSNYGKAFIVWFDGAHGGDGFYGGAREARIIDNRTYYDWFTTWDLVRKLQPGAVIFSDAGPDVRWVGNEQGTASDPCWYTINRKDCYPGMPNYTSLGPGLRSGEDWVPPECDVSIRPGWFYHAREDVWVKSPSRLVDIYCKSIGRGACLNLNVPLDTTGQIHQQDLTSLHGLKQWIDGTFATNLAAHATVVARNVRGNDPQFSAENLLDDSRAAYWCTDDDVNTPDVVLDFGKPLMFSIVRLRELLPLGQRVEGFALDDWQNGTWHEFARGFTIGNQRLIRVKPIQTEKLRLRITKAPVCPALSEFSVFLEPKQFQLSTSPP